MLLWKPTKHKSLKNSMNITIFHMSVKNDVCKANDFLPVVHTLALQ